MSVSRPKPRFLILDFHYGVAQMNEAMLRSLGYETELWCASTHFLNHAPRSQFATELRHGKLLQRYFELSRADSRWHPYMSAQRMMLRYPSLRRLVKRCDYILCSFPPMLVWLAQALARRYNKRVFLLTAHRFNAHLRTYAANQRLHRTLLRLADSPRDIFAVYGNYEAQYTRHYLPHLPQSAPPTFPLVAAHLPLEENSSSEPQYSYKHAARTRWLPQIEIYQRPLITQFDSVDELLEQLSRLEHRKVAAAMLADNKKRRARAQTIWQDTIATSWARA